MCLHHQAMGRKNIKGSIAEWDHISQRRLQQEYLTHRRTSSQWLPRKPPEGKTTCVCICLFVSAQLKCYSAASDKMQHSRWTYIVFSYKSGLENMYFGSLQDYIHSFGQLDVWTQSALVWNDVIIISVWILELRPKTCFLRSKWTSEPLTIKI